VLAEHRVGSHLRMSRIKHPSPRSLPREKNSGTREGFREKEGERVRSVRSPCPCSPQRRDRGNAITRGSGNVNRVNADLDFGQSRFTSLVFSLTLLLLLLLLLLRLRVRYLVRISRDR
jgi:hypothetical protein